MIRVHAFITVPIDGEKPPTEFCLIHAGANESENGPYNYDEKSRKTVMEGYKRRGIDCMFDWHHASLDPHPADPKEAIKAAGWYKLEDRPDGLWATEIKWTPAALESFASKEIRYFSPAFDADKTGRVIDYINCALTNLPATHNNEQLIAAARMAGKGETMTEDEKKKMEALEAEVAKYKKAEEKREEARKADEEAKKNAFPPAKDDEDEDDEDEEDNETKEGCHPIWGSPSGGCPKESVKKKAKKHASEDEDEESRKMSIDDLNSIIVKQSTEIAQLKSSGSSVGELETRVNAAVKSGILAPSLKRWALANGSAFSELEKSTKAFRRTEHRMPEDKDQVIDVSSDPKAMKLAREVGEALGNSDDQIQRGIKAARTVK